MEREDDNNIEYVASPTGRKFHAGTEFVRAVMGPVGSGKSSMMVMEILMKAMAQKPYKGVRRTRFGVIRNTFAELKSTTIKTWEYWTGSLGTLVYGSPITWTCDRQLPDGTRMIVEVMFIPLDSEKDVKKLKSLELTGAWVNEASEVPMAILKVLRGRVGRFPSQQVGGPSWVGILLDTNPPSTRSDFYNLFEVEKPKGHRIWYQPGGLVRNPDYDDRDPESPQYLPNPEAENIRWLPGGYDYYYNQANGASEDYVKVFILGEYGSTYAGKAVYSNYVDAQHASKEFLEPIRPGQLVVGLDFGLNPAAVISQMTPHGSLNVLDEIAPQDVTLGEFLDEYLVPLLQQPRYRGCTVICVGDPTGANRNSYTKRSCFDELKMRNLPGVPARTNDILLRREAVGFYLSRRNGFMLSPRCVVLRDGFNGAYHFEELTTKGEYKEKPAKNYASHPHDALQYIALYFRTQAVTSAARRSRPATSNERPMLWA